MKTANFENGNNTHELLQKAIITSQQFYKLCGQTKHSCRILQRFTSTSVAQNASSNSAENAKQAIKQQLEFEVNIPKAKTWSDTAVLQALASTVVNDVNIPYQHLESPQFWFNGPYTEETRHKLRMHGRATANFVIDQNKQLFQNEFDADSIEPWINLEGEKVPSIDVLNEGTEDAESNADEDYDPLQNMKKFLEKKKIPAVLQSFLRLSQEKAEIPPEILNHFLGFCAFYKGSHYIKSKYDKDPTEMFSTKNRQNGPADGSANITKVYQAVPADNVDYLSTKILSYPHNTNMDCANVLSIYKNEVKDHMKLDVTVYNYVLLCLGDAELMNSYGVRTEIMDAMKRHGVRPNYETFVNFMTHIPPPYLTSGETLLNYYAQVLLEMKELDIEPGLSMFYTLMRSATRLNRNSVVPALHAILDFMDGKNFQYQHASDVPALSRMMSVCSRDLTLVKKLMKISQHGKNTLILHSNHMKSYSFYSTFLSALCLHDTMENLFYYIQKLVPARINLDFGFRKKIFDRIQKERRPEFLPLLYIYYPPYQYYEGLKTWLNVAILLLDCADDSTKTQMKHIALIELKFCESQQQQQDFSKVINSCFKLLLLTSTGFMEVASVFETLLRMSSKFHIDENLLQQFEKLGEEYNRGVHASQLVSKFRKR